MNIVIVVGTNRAGSMSKKVSLYLSEKYQAEGCSVHIVDLSKLPAELMTPDIYGNPKPDSFNSFHDPILNADGVVFVVPEYNGSFPGILKFYIDLWQYPQAFEKRCVAFVGISSNQWGALRPIEHLQGVFGYRNAWQFNERVFLNHIWSRWNDEEKNFRPMTPKDLDYNALLDSQTKGFVEFCKVHSQS